MRATLQVSALRSIAGLRPPLDVEGPRVRLGLAWAAAGLVAVVLGPVVCAVVFAAVSLGAAGQAARAWRRSERQPYRPVAVGGATLVALAAAAGPVAVAAAAVLTGVAAVVAAQGRFDRKTWDASLTTAIALIAGIAGASVPLARSELGTAATLVLLGTVHVADATTFVIGSGARTSYDAPVAATTAIAVVSMGVAAVLVPPFRGASPWVLGAVAAVLIPASRRAASAVLPNPAAFAPALRRLDSFTIAGPVWVLVAAALLDLP